MTFFFCSGGYQEIFTILIITHSIENITGFSRHFYCVFFFQLHLLLLSLLTSLVGFLSKFLTAWKALTVNRTFQTSMISQVSSPSESMGSDLWTRLKILRTEIKYLGFGNDWYIMETITSSFLGIRKHFLGRSVLQIGLIYCRLWKDTAGNTPSSG